MVILPSLFESTVRNIHAFVIGKRDVHSVTGRGYSNVGYLHNNFL